MSQSSSVGRQKSDGGNSPLIDLPLEQRLKQQGIPLTAASSYTLENVQPSELPVEHCVSDITRRIIRFNIANVFRTSGTKGPVAPMFKLRVPFTNFLQSVTETIIWEDIMWYRTWTDADKNLFESECINNTWVQFMFLKFDEFMREKSDDFLNKQKNLISGDPIPPFVFRIARPLSIRDEMPDDVKMLLDWIESLINSWVDVFNRIYNSSFEPSASYAPTLSEKSVVYDKQVVAAIAYAGISNIGHLDPMFDSTKGQCNSILVADQTTFLIEQILGRKLERGDNVPQSIRSCAKAFVKFSWENLNVKSSSYRKDLAQDGLVVSCFCEFLKNNDCLPAEVDARSLRSNSKKTESDKTICDLIFAESSRLYRSILEYDRLRKQEQRKSNSIADRNKSITAQQQNRHHLNAQDPQKQQQSQYVPEQPRQQYHHQQQQLPQQQHQLQPQQLRQQQQQQYSPQNQQHASPDANAGYRSSVSQKGDTRGCSRDNAIDVNKEQHYAYIAEYLDPDSDNNNNNTATTNNNNNNNMMMMMMGQQSQPAQQQQQPQYHQFQRQLPNNNNNPKSSFGVVGQQPPQRTSYAQMPRPAHQRQSKHQFVSGSTQQQASNGKQPLQQSSSEYVANRAMTKNVGQVFASKPKSNLLEQAGCSKIIASGNGASMLIDDDDDATQELPQRRERQQYGEDEDENSGQEAPDSSGDDMDELLSTGKSNKKNEQQSQASPTLTKGTTWPDVDSLFGNTENRNIVELDMCQDGSVCQYPNSVSPEDRPRWVALRFRGDLANITDKASQQAIFELLVEVPDYVNYCLNTPCAPSIGAVYSREQRLGSRPEYLAKRLNDIQRRYRRNVRQQEKHAAKKNKFSL